MKAVKIILLLALTFFLTSCSSEQEDNNESLALLNEVLQNDNNESNKTQDSNETINAYDKLIHFKSKEKDLEYLFEDSKFPVDDYIAMGGKKKPRQNVYEAFNKSKQGNESVDDIKKKQEAEFRRKMQEELLAKSGTHKGNVILDENGNPILDANGNPMYENIMYDEYGNMLLDCNGNPMYKNIVYDKKNCPMFDEKGNVIKKENILTNEFKGSPLLDENGNPRLDANGNPMYDNVYYDKDGKPLYDKDGKVLLLNDPLKGKMLLDENGNPILDANGNPMYDNVYYDKDGKPLYDKDGKVLLLNDPLKGKMLLDENGNPILDANGNPRYENIMYDENGYPILDCNGNPMLKTLLYDSNKCPLYDENGNPIYKNQAQAQNQALAKEKEELKRLIEEQKRLNQQMKNNINQAGANAGANGGYPYNLKSIIRDSILADRGNTNIAFSNPSSRYGVDSFSNQKNVDEATHEHKLLRTLRAGRLIPALLTTAISSDIEGPVTAIVEQDIYASMGKAVLIPRGSKVIGFYQNDNKIGQDRLSITWREIITPQGVNILLTNAITSDNMGMSGAYGNVNNKYFDRYGIPYGISTLSNVLLLAIASKADGNVYTQSIYDQSSKDVSTLVESIIEQQGQIKPTIEIKAGSRIFITPSAHIWFPKPQNNEVLAEFYND
ncbi:DNA type IV secretion system protein ComB10 [Campylobacter troglodytis]|uniref:DNA type IV secretion system protein ComB10 n=1 Tax=Campylobacter troglodytis TaxID=654363 RepID=UPI001FE74CFD|nr:DNA type IV secretion system protein ComB10 [Campylobacter troglodytis]